MYTLWLNHKGTHLSTSNTLKKNIDSISINYKSHIIIIITVYGHKSKEFQFKNSKDSISVIKMNRTLMRDQVKTQLGKTFRSRWLSWVTASRKVTTAWGAPVCGSFSVQYSQLYCVSLMTLWFISLQKSHVFSPRSANQLKYTRYIETHWHSLRVYSVFIFVTIKVGGDIFNILCVWNGWSVV